MPFFEIFSFSSTFILCYKSYTSFLSLRICMLFVFSIVLGSWQALRVYAYNLLFSSLTLKTEISTSQLVTPDDHLPSLFKVELKKKVS